MRFTRAIVRPPAPNFAQGLTTSGLGEPDYELALNQHEAYCAALERCGLKLFRLDADPNFPDSTFVEDVAVLTEHCAILTRPGALTRRGEVESMRPVMKNLFASVHEIQSPGTLDGGDVCQADNRFFIGVSDRTNESGAAQLARILKAHGYDSISIDMKSVPGAGATGSPLHLKSGLAYIGENRMVITDDFCGRSEFTAYDSIHLTTDEKYGANCIRVVNDYVLVAAGHPQLEKELRELRYQIIVLEMSEFKKMDGGLSCLSLRF
jgi:dimethylargininase